MKYDLILGVFILFLVFNMYFAVNNGYEDKRYTVSINDAQVEYHLEEQYVYNSVPIFVHVKNWKSEDVSNDTHISMINSSLVNPTIKFKTYECFNKSTGKKISCESTSARKLEKYSTIIPYKMVIQNKGKVIYNGKYVEDLKNIINTSGRYYFNLYLKDSEKAFEDIRTEISFQVKFVGDKYE